MAKNIFKNVNFDAIEDNARLWEQCDLYNGCAYPVGKLPHFIFVEADKSSNAIEMIFFLPSSNLGDSFIYQF